VWHSEGGVYVRGVREWKRKQSEREIKRETDSERVGEDLILN